MPFQDDDKLQVQQATDIVRLIGEQVALRAKGREFLGLCPFHDDQNPSMHVSPAKQIYKCFSCGAGGDVFSFVMNYHKMTFPEAIKHLAERAGIELTPRKGSRSDAEGPGERQRIAAANDLALNFFRKQLQSPPGQIARDYIVKRTINDAMTGDFALGYAPDAWDELAKAIRGKGWALKDFELAGLVSPRKGGDGFYDRLRHRLIFPIFDAIGRPIAFGGRKLRDEDEPKYLNSPETKLFNKSATLYGLHLAKKPIIDAKTAVIVEGYTDVISCHQVGLNNVVATLGTALTLQHVVELRRYAEKVVLIFDPDAAGQKAADRAVEVFLTGDVDVSIAELPGGLDPADLLAQPGGADQWQSAMAAAEDALAYQFSRISSQIDDAETVTGRQHVIENYLQRLAAAGLNRNHPVRQAFILRRLSELLNLDEQQIRRVVAQAAPVRRPENPTERTSENAQSGAVGSETEENENNPPVGFAPGESGNRLKAVRLAERQLIGCLLRYNELFHHPLSDGRSVDEAVVPEDMVTAEHRRLYQRVYDRLAEGDGTEEGTESSTLRLTDLLGDLAADDEQELANLATDADAQVDRAGFGMGVEVDEDQVRAVLIAAAEKIMEYHREQAYRRDRPTLADKDIAAVERRLREHFSWPSAIRIAKKS